MLAEQTEENIRMAFGPKVLAALLLPKLLEPTDFVVFFSSVAAVLGSPGQVPYSAANAVLDGYSAFAVRSQGSRMLSIQWGPWKEAGMAANEKALRRASDFGFGAWSNDQGFAILEDLVRIGAGGVISAVSVAWERFQWPSYSSLTSNFVPAKRFVPKSELARSEPFSQTAVVTTLKNLTEAMLGHEVSAEEPLMDAGMDSLLAVEFARRLSREFGQVLPVTIVFDCPTLGAIADRIKRGMTTHGLGETTSKALPVGLTNGMALVSASSLLPFCFGLDSMLQGLDCVTGVPFARLDLDAYFSPDIEAEGMTYTKHAACMDGVEWFGNFFNINATEARTMDPQQRLLLDTAVSANCEALDGSDAAVVVGKANHDWSFQDHLATSFMGTAVSPAITANRLSFLLNLKGPSMTIDTACSSSLVALATAMRLPSSQALVGGTHVILSPVPFIGSCAAKMLSKVGRCLTLDASADGYCRGEGVAALILQPSADAKVAGILSVATNHDGRSASLTAPNGKAQENLFRTSLALASLQTVDVVELHGTGTKLGDPLEAASTMAVFGKSGKPVCGAVKSNMGHLEGSAGMAGLFKLICTLRNKAGSPNLHLKCLNQHISSNIIVSEACADLRQSTATLSGAVSSFGFGGSNAQALLMPGTRGKPSSKPHDLGGHFAWSSAAAWTYATRWERVGAKVTNQISLTGPAGLHCLEPVFIDTSQGANMLAISCWTAKAEEEEIENLTLRAIEMLRILQQAAASKETWFVVVAGNGAFAEACFSAVSSMLRSALCEQPLDVQVVHVNATTWESVRSILAETKLPLISEDPVCRVVDGVLEAPRLQKWIPDSSVTRAAICTGGRYVVTGGSGALGESCVQWLLGRGAGHVTILSRSEPEFSDERVRWLKCDVSKAADLKATAAKCKDSQDVNGIVHAAGVLADKMLAEQTQQNIRMAFGPKVLAALLLPKLLEPTDFVVFFSSVAAVLGSPGQVPYSAANAALDGYCAFAVRSQGTRMLSVQWGPWKEAGMAANEKALRRARDFGFGAWSNDQGVAILEHLVRSGAGGVISAVSVAWERFQWPSHSSLTSNFAPAKRFVSKSELARSEPFPQSAVVTTLKNLTETMLGHEVSAEEPLMDAG
ncbi:unnamed protein product, partial [Durusdinium trenchii]